MFIIITSIHGNASHRRSCRLSSPGKYETLTSKSSGKILNFIELQDRLRAIQELIHEIDNERRRNETNLNNLHRIQEKHNSDEKSNSYQHKYKNLLKTCMNDAAQEENKIRQALAKITEVRNIRNERRIQVSK